MNNRMYPLPGTKRPRPHGANAAIRGIWLATATSLLVTCAAGCSESDSEGDPATTTTTTTTSTTTSTTTTTTTTSTTTSTTTTTTAEPELLVELGPETGVDAPVLGPAMGTQSRPAAAFNGSTYLVVWGDDRPSGAFGARVAQDGAVLDPASISLPSRMSGVDVASDGDGFLVVGVGGIPLPGEPSPGLVATRVSAAGAVLGTSVLTAAPGAETAHVASSGAEYLVVWEEHGASPADPRALRRARVALDGTVLDPGGIMMDDAITSLVDVAFDGTSYVTAWNSAGPFTGRAATVSPQGDLLQESAIPVFAVAMDCDAGRCVLAWTEDNDVKTARLTPDGVVLDPQGVLVASSGSGDGRLAVGFHGADAVVAWSVGSSDGSIDNVHYARVASDGVVLDPGGALLLQDGLSSARASDPTFAWDGDRAILFWSDGRYEIGGGQAAIYGARLTAGGLGLDGAEQLVSKGANGQINPSLAFDGQSFLLTWTDGRNIKDLQGNDVYGARMSADGALLDPAVTLLGAGPWTQGPARAVFDGSSTLVAWWDCQVLSPIDVDCTIAGTRLGAGGATPLSFPFHNLRRSTMPPALSGGGGSALVSAFREEALLATAAVGPDGVGGPDVFTGYTASTRVASAFDGVNHLVVWLPEPQGSGPLLASMVTPDGTVLQPFGFPVAPVNSVVQSFSIAFGGGSYLVAWHDTTNDAPRILATRVSPDGVVLDATPALVQEHAGCPTYAVKVGASAVAFDGERFALGWSACGPGSIDLFGAVVDTHSEVAAHFAITSDAYPDEAPALGGTDAGATLIAYSSFHADAPLGAWRLHTRRLDVSTVPADVSSASP